MRGPDYLSGVVVGMAMAGSAVIIGIMLGAGTTWAADEFAGRHRCPAALPVRKIAADHDVTRMEPAR